MICTTCLVDKVADSFSFRNKEKNIRHRICKLCHADVARSHYRTNSGQYIGRAAQWKLSHTARKRAISAKYTNLSRVAPLCKCCSQSQFLEYFYCCPPNHHVDHIMAIKDGGIHCIQNLQYLSASAHGRKSCAERYARGK